MFLLVTRDYGAFVAIMALPYKWVSLLDFDKLLKTQDAMFGDTPKHKVKRRLALRGLGPTGRRPDAKLFKTSINIFPIHGAIYPMNRRIFQVDGV